MQQLSLTSWLVLLLPLLLPLICFLLYPRQDDPNKQKQPRAGGVGDDDGLKPYPLLGRLPHLLKNQHNLIEWSLEVAKRSPTQTMSFNALGMPGLVITANPGNVEHIAKASFGNYPKGDRLSSTIEDFLGRGIFNSDGEQWLWQRKAASYEFSKRSLRKFIVDTIAFEVAERLLPLLRRAAAARDGGRAAAAVDMQRVFECFAFDNICQMAFGDDPACLVAAEEEEDGAAAAAAPRPAAVEFMRAFDFVQNAILVRFNPPENFMWRLKRALGVEPERRIREALAVVHRYADGLVRRCRERAAEEEEEEEESIRGGDFLSHFAARGDGISDESLRDVVTNFLLAGRDTTSSALTWFFWLVSGRPDVEAKIVDEIRKVRRRSRSSPSSHGAAAAAFSFGELRDMHYIHAAVTESMRLYPPVPLGMHRCRRDDVLPDGTFVGGGWSVGHSVYAMGRLESVWGEGCEEFRPERWLREEDGTLRFRPESPFKYPVFHAGPRMCLGKEMAYIQMKSIVACALERFSFRFLGGEERPGLDFSFTLRMKGGLPMQVTERPGTEAVDVGHA